jgi:ubiquinone/menaquinone biosynthesis C-methylase UbiE
LERLQTQARLIDPHTRQFFLDAGVEPGMRVLDVGSGAGDVAFVVASLVGRSGVVVGVDRSTTAIALANERARADSVANVSFRVGDPFAGAFDEPFDAVVGRYVLQFQPDPVAALHAVGAHARRPGGLVAFHEIDWGGVDSFPTANAYDRTCGWIRDALVASRTESRMGIKLYSTFVEAGFADPSLARRSVVGAGDDAAVIATLIVDLANTLRTEIVGEGIASAEAFDATMSALPMEVGDRPTVLVAHGQFCVWGHVGAITSPSA